MSSSFTFLFPLIKISLIEGFSATMKITSFALRGRLDIYLNVGEGTQIKNGSKILADLFDRKGLPSRLLIAPRMTPSSTLTFPRIMIL